MKQQAKETYFFPYHEDNMYGHVVRLLSKHVVGDGQAGAEGIHLDIGCGYGAIAEHLETKVGGHYVGVDGSEYGLKKLHEQGFEAHQLVVDGTPATRQRLEEIIAGRRVCSITMLDLVEHLYETENFLAILAEIARQHGAYFVISCPNNTHRDIGARLLVGLWDYTKTGLLDYTHVKLFGEDTLLRSLNSVGFVPIDRDNVCYDVSELSFPKDHIAFASSSALNNVLFSVADGANIYSKTYQFVWLCKADEPQDVPLYVDYHAEEVRPFLSIIMRTQGKRAHTFKEALTALLAQTNTDFELLIIGHKCEARDRDEIQAIIANYPTWFQEKCRFIECWEGNRTRPLNVGFSAAKGHYVVILDDDDLPFAHWVEIYHELAQLYPGRVLRASCVVQEVETIGEGDEQGLRASDATKRQYPTHFDFVAHFHHNESPNLILAFPRSAYHDLNIHFDETLTTTEDWDFLLRCVAVCGVASSPEVTAIYRWWIKDESSRTLHDEREWQENYQKIIKKIETMPIILPPGEILKATSKIFSNVKAPSSFVERDEILDEEMLVRSSRRILARGVRIIIFVLKLKGILVFPIAKKRRKVRKKIREIMQLKQYFEK